MAGGRYRRRRPDEQEAFGVQLNLRTGPPPGPEILPWYWHPDREGGMAPPAAIQAQIKAFDPDLRAVFSPVHERWLIWVKNPRRQNTLCSGWQLLFLWEHQETKAYLPLGDPPALLFHNLYLIMASRFPSGLAYYEQIQDGIAKAKAAQEKTYQDDRRTSQAEIRDSWKISTAGKGNKSALYHSGTIVESPGEAAWRAQTRKARIPAAQLKAEIDEREKQFYGR